MKRRIGSLVSVIALLAISATAAAVNVRILHGNEAERSVLEINEAAAVSALDDPAAMSEASNDSAAGVSVDSIDDETPQEFSAHSPVPKRDGKNAHALGRVSGTEDDGDRKHRKRDGKHDGLPRLSPIQKQLLRVAALAQVSPLEARDAAAGVGPTDVVNRVTTAAAQVGVSLADLAAVTDLPPAKERRHGGDDHDELEGDDDD